MTTGAHRRRTCELAHQVNELAAEIAALCDHALLSSDPSATGRALGRIQEVALRMGRVGGEMLALSAPAGAAPAAPAPSPAPSPPSPSPSPGPGRRLLVVDDNADLRELLVEALRTRFSEVHQAADGPEAVARLEAADGGYDLVLLDLRMPGPNGMQVLAEAHARWPRLPIVVTSAAAPEGVVRAAVAAGARAVLPKPFRMAELRDVVKRVLGEG